MLTKVAILQCMREGRREEGMGNAHLVWRYSPEQLVHT
jgi:hypothetical protein